jgi:predicted dehydrogenase
LTPPQTHADLAIAAMEAGVHVLVEKPMSATLEEADRMIETAQRMGVQLCVDHNRLFDPVVLKAKQMIATGELGEVVGVEAFQGFPQEEGRHMYYRTSAETHWSFDLPGGIMQNVGPHAIAFMLAFIPDCTPVSIVTKRTGVLPGTPFEEVRMLFEGEKALGSLTFSFSPRPFLNFVTLYGSQASLQINLNNMTLIVYKDYRLPKLVAKSWFNLDQSLQLVSNTVRTTFQVLTGRLRFFPGMKNLIHRYYTCLENGDPLPVTAEEGREVVKVLDLICQQPQVYADQQGSTGPHT